MFVEIIGGAAVTINQSLMPTLSFINEVAVERNYYATIPGNLQ